MKSIFEYINKIKKQPYTINKNFQEMMEYLFKEFDTSKSYNILDCGTGRSSLTYLTTTFPKSFITAVTFPGDRRKIDSINTYVTAKNYKLIEQDIATYKPSHKFDIILADKVLGEASKFNNNTFPDILNKILNFPYAYIIILDGYDDQNIDWEYIFSVINDNKLKIIKRKIWNGNWLNIKGDTFATKMIGLVIKK